jgi:Flp pilus assembly protein TadD
MGLVSIPASLLAQEGRPRTPQEMMQDMQADLQGQRNEVQEATRIHRPVSSAFGPWPVPRAEPQQPARLLSVASLLHRVPKAAQKAYDRGIDFVRKGDPSQAVEELEKATKLDPAFSSAHGDLGVLYAQLGRLRDGESEIRQAIVLDPYVSLTHSNLGWVLFQQRSFSDAERSARRALSLSPTNDPAHLLLGIMLGGEPATRAEGVRHLKQAIATFPEVAKTLEELGER